MSSTNYDQAGVQNINSILFLFISHMTVTYMIPVVHVLPRELPIFLRENNDGLYTVFNYFLSKVIVDLPRYLIFPFMYITLAYWICGLIEFTKYLVCLLTIIIITNVAASFGMFISALSPTVTIAINVLTPLSVPLMIMSGLYVNSKTVPIYLIWLRDLSWYHYAYEILIVSQWSDIDKIECNSIGNSTVDVDKCFNTGRQVIESLGFDEVYFYIFNTKK
jgi:ATP-binding cassette, subfamily G (WHITE), eye pigment precursor transporter